MGLSENRGPPNFMVLNLDMVVDPSVSGTKPIKQSSPSIHLGKVVEVQVFGSGLSRTAAK